MPKFYEPGSYTKLGLTEDDVRALIKKETDRLAMVKKDYKKSRYVEEVIKSLKIIEEAREEFFKKTTAKQDEVRELLSLKVAPIRPMRPKLTTPNVLALQYSQSVIRSRLSYEAKNAEEFLDILYEITDKIAPWDPENRENVDAFRKRIDNEPMRELFNGEQHPMYASDSIMKWALLDMFGEVKVLANKLYPVRTTNRPSEPLDQNREGFIGNEGYEYPQFSPDFVPGKESEKARFFEQLDTVYKLSTISLLNDNQVEKYKTIELERKELEKESMRISGMKMRQQIAFDRFISTHRLENYNAIAEIQDVETRNDTLYFGQKS